MDDVKKMKKVYDIFSQSYDKEYAKKREQSSFAKVLQLYERLFWERLTEHLGIYSKNIHILDAGGGTGLWTLPLVKEGYKVTYLDLSEGMLNKARDKIRDANVDSVEFVLGSITEMPFADGTFDFVVCEGDIISKCYENYQQGLAEVSRVLKQGGGLYLGIDNLFPYLYVLLSKKQFTEALELLENRVFYNDKEGPSYLFLPDEIKSLLEKQNMIIEKMYGTPVFTHLLPRNEEYNSYPDLMEKLFQLERSIEPFNLLDSGWHLHIFAKRGS